MPARSNVRAISAPMPRDAPVTSAVVGSIAPVSPGLRAGASGLAHQGWRIRAATSDEAHQTSTSDQANQTRPIRDVGEGGSRRARRRLGPPGAGHRPVTIPPPRRTRWPRSFVASTHRTASLNPPRRRASVAEAISRRPPPRRQCSCRRYSAVTSPVAGERSSPRPGPTWTKPINARSGSGSARSR